MRLSKKSMIVIAVSVALVAGSGRQSYIFFIRPGQESRFEIFEAGGV